MRMSRRRCVLWCGFCRWSLLAIFGVVNGGGGLCPATEVCEAGRLCEFGRDSVYVAVRNAAYSVTGYSTACVDECSCDAAPDNRVARLLREAAVNNSL
jgi:hypothetical protein